MTIENVVDWYDKNVNYKLTKTFIEFLINTGIISSDINIELLNMFLLETYGNEFVKDDGKFKIKENRKNIIDRFKEKNEVVQLIKAQNNEDKKARKKFKIESLGGKKLKLVKL
jgi:hypothetical protein